MRPTATPNAARAASPSAAPSPARAGRNQEPLHEYQIEPAAELVADLAEAGDALEPEPRVKADRGIVGRIDAADHHVFSQRQRGGKQRLDEGASDAAAAHVAAHVDRVFDRVAISRPGAAPLPERGKAENLAALGGHQHRKPLGAARGEPRAALGERCRLRRVDRGRSGDHVVVDRQDARKVGFARRAHIRHRFAPVGFVCYITNMSTIVDDLDSRLGARLKIERERRGWALTDLAQRSGVSRAMINKVERGAAGPTAALLGRLSGAFGLTLSALLARTEMSGAGRLVRADDQLRWTDPATGYIRRQVAPAPGSDLPLDLVQVELPASAAGSFPAAAYAFGRQVVWVL